MLTVSEFCFSIDRTKPPNLKSVSFEEALGLEFKPEPQMPSVAQRNEMSEAEVEVLFERPLKLRKLLESYKKSSVFRQVLNRSLEFRDP